MTTTAVRNKVGLAIALLLGIADFTGPAPAAIAAALLFPRPTGNSADPWSIDPNGPAVVGVVATAIALGLTTVVGAVLTLARGNRIAARVVAAARAVAVVIILPVFLLGELEPWITVLAATLVILNITAIVLVLSRPAVSAAPAR